MKNFYKGKEILITGGAGTLGRAITRLLLKECSDIHGIRIYSRDEEKHRLFKKELSEEFGESVPVAFLIGDIRDLQRLTRAMNRTDIVIHAAAMKQIPHCEFNPIEAVRTNVEGTCNVIDAAVNNIVQNAMLISTDKACYPVNLYGATKATAEKLFLHANVYSPYTTKFSICRYGNVFGSRGSVIQIWREQYKKTKTITITDDKMTRFWISVNQVARFVLEKLTEAKGAEIFVPEMKSCTMHSFSKAIVPEDAIIKTMGVRRGEKNHECLITKEESLYTEQLQSYYRISFKKQICGIPWHLTSENAEQFSEEELNKIIKAEE